MNTFGHQSTAGTFIPSKSQYYVNDGVGRASYIYNINGGFAPEKKATAIHEIGKYFLEGSHVSYRIIRYTKEGASFIYGTHPFQACRIYCQWLR